MGPMGVVWTTLKKKKHYCGVTNFKTLLKTCFEEWASKDETAASIFTRHNFICNTYFCSNVYTLKTKKWCTDSILYLVPRCNITAIKSLGTICGLRGKVKMSGIFESVTWSITDIAKKIFFTSRRSLTASTIFQAYVPFRILQNQKKGFQPNFRYLGLRNPKSISKCCSYIPARYAQIEIK